MKRAAMLLIMASYRELGGRDSEALQLEESTQIKQVMASLD